MKKLAYPKNQSPLYKLKSKKKLAKLLYTDYPGLKQCINSNKRYRGFEKKVNKKMRLFEPPIGLNKKIHARIYQLLLKVDDIPKYLHSGIKGRSYVSNAKQHLQSKYFLTIDIQDFYPTTNKDKIFLFFCNYFQCSTDVADILSQILTHNDHLVQGSCVSQILSFYSNKYMFDEIKELTISKDLLFTLYVDDLTFSSEQVFDSKKIISSVSEILYKSGYKVKRSKTKFSKIGNVTGVIVRNNKLLVRNKTHEKIHQLKNKDNLKIKQIVGQARYIDPSFYKK
ncbi:reverse transcriptase family protein [Francisellaceae bacterium CB299]